MARQLRRLAASRPERDPVRRRYVFVLDDRVAAVRADLLQLAAMIERAPVIDARCFTELRNLLTNGCDSPLYNREIHVSELHASLYYVRYRLQG